MTSLSKVITNLDSRVILAFYFQILYNKSYEYSVTDFIIYVLTVLDLFIIRKKVVPLLLILF